MLLQALCSASYPMVNSNWSYSPETPNLGQLRRFLEPCDLEIWRMTLKNNRAPLLCCFQLCAWFHCHMWIQTGVRVRKRLSWVLTSVTLTFDLWPWPFAWTSLLTMVITPENFMMIRWWEHGEKGVTDRRTDGRTDRRTDGRTENTICRAAWSQLKTQMAFHTSRHKKHGECLLLLLACKFRRSQHVNLKLWLYHVIGVKRYREAENVHWGSETVYVSSPAKRRFWIPTLGLVSTSCAQTAALTPESGDVW